MALVTALVFMASTFVLGGWPWTLISLLFLIMMLLPPGGDLSTVASVLAACSIGMFWLAAYRWTGDRRLFFPFAMQFAAQAMYLSRFRIPAGCALAAAFLGIRIAQSATVEVLVVEALIGFAILPFALQAAGPRASGSKSRLLAGALGSLAAFASLVI